jgi:hypothetical protein
MERWKLVYQNIYTLALGYGEPLKLIGFMFKAFFKCHMDLGFSCTLNYGF